MRLQVSEADACARLAELLNGVSKGDEVVIERDGKVVGALISPNRYRAIEEDGERLWATIDKLHQLNAGVDPTVIEAEVAEAVAAVRAEDRTKAGNAAGQ